MDQSETLHALHKLRKKRARKAFVVQADSKVTYVSYYHEANLPCHELLVVFGL